MPERQDIDALLVGALYGELSSAEQAQLAAHLESHPADRSALADLKVVRERFAASRIFAAQAEPPQSVSALLLQEAARRAPKQVLAADRKQSWFDRFVRSFIAHPAVAAAATLVLVLGVAGTIYLQGGEPAQPRVAPRGGVMLQTPGPVAGGWGSATLGSPEDTSAIFRAQGEIAGASAGDQAEGRKRDAVTVALADDKPATTAAPNRGQGDVTGFADDAKGKAEVARHPASAADLAKPAPAPAKDRYVEVPKASPQPKDLDGERAEYFGKAGISVPNAVANNAGRPDPRADSSERGATSRGPILRPEGGAAGAPSGSVAVGDAPAPPPVASPSVAAEPPAPRASARPEASVAWAREQHEKIIALVKDGNCPAAVPLASTLKTRAPDYYATNVATDRALKSCMQYVDESATERAAEKKKATKAAKAADTR